MLRLGWIGFKLLGWETFTFLLLTNEAAVALVPPNAELGARPNRALPHTGVFCVQLVVGFDRRSPTHEFGGFLRMGLPPVLAPLMRTMRPFRQFQPYLQRVRPNQQLPGLTFGVFVD